jgi:hypothetical protein
MKIKLFVLIIALLVVSSSFADVVVENGMVSFYFESETASTVYLVGNFNNWDPFATPMKGEDGEWFVQLKLKPGVYEYAFVINGTKTVEDPNEYGSIKNDLGTYNSVFVLKMSGSKLVIDAEASRNYAKKVETAKNEKEKMSKTEIALPENYEPNVPKDKNLAPKIINGKVLFSFKAPADTKIVYLAGSFNSWSSNKLAMKENGNLWTTELKLSDGVYQYKFVINGKDWKKDPNAYGYAPDGYGGKNSVLIIKDSKIFIPKVKENNVVTIEKKNVPQGGVSIENGLVVFRLKYPSANKVALAGTFNNWNKSALIMKLINGFWEAKLKLEPGSYEYKYVIDDNTWIEDPKAYEYVPDPYGGRNSVITLKKENGELVIVKPEKKKGSNSLIGGKMQFKFALRKNSLWFSSDSYNNIILEIHPKIPNVKFSSEFNVNTVGWAVNFKGMNLKIENSPFSLDIYNNWCDSNTNFLNSESIEASTIGIYGEAFGLFAQVGNISDNFYYSIGYKGKIANIDFLVGYFDKDYSKIAFGYDFETLALQSKIDFGFLRATGEINLYKTAFKSASLKINNDIFAAEILDLPSHPTLNAKYFYSFANISGKLSITYVASNISVFAYGKYKTSEDSYVKLELKYIDSKINWNIVYNYQKNNVKFYVFSNNLPINIDNIEDDVKDYSESTIALGIGTEVDF